MTAVARIAKDVRAAIATARRAGELGDLPNEMTIGVVSRDGDTIDIVYRNAPASWARHDLVIPGGCGCWNRTPEGCVHRDVMTPAAITLGETLLELCRRHAVAHNFRPHVFVIERGVMVSAHYER